MNPECLKDIVSMRMPFGKYKGVLICNLPESYLVWFHEKGFPQGKLGTLLQTMYEIRLNGLEYLLAPIKANVFPEPGKLPLKRELSGKEPK